MNKSVSARARVCVSQSNATIADCSLGVGFFAIFFLEIIKNPGRQYPISRGVLSGIHGGLFSLPRVRLWIAAHAVIHTSRVFSRRKTRFGVLGTNERGTHN